MNIIYRGSYRYFSRTEGKVYIPVVVANVKNRHLRRHFPKASQAVDYARSVIARYQRLFATANK